MEKKYGALSSSKDPQQLALRVQSSLYALIPAIVLLAKLKGIELIDGDLKLYVDALANLIIYGGFLVTGIMHLWGWIRSFNK